MRAENHHVSSKADHQRARAHGTGDPLDTPGQQHQFAPRTAHQQYSQQLIVAPGQRNGVKRLRAGRIGSPVDRAGHRFLRLLLALLDQRKIPVGMRRHSIRIRQFRGREARLQVLIQQRAHSRGQHQRSQKILVQPPPADDVEIFVSNRKRAHHRQRQRHAVGQFLFVQKRMRITPVFIGDPVVLVSHARRILRRRNQRSIGVDKLHEIQAVILRRAGPIVHVQRLIGIGPRQIQRHAQGNFRVGDIFHLASHFFAALRKFLLELRHQRLGALRVHFLKSRARVIGHAVSRHKDRRQHRQHENQHQFGAKAHRNAPLASPRNFARLWISGHEEESISRLTAEVKEIARIRIPGGSALLSVPWFTLHQGRRGALRCTAALVVGWFAPPQDHLRHFR